MDCKVLSPKNQGTPYQNFKGTRGDCETFDEPFSLCHNSAMFNNFKKGEIIFLNYHSKILETRPVIFIKEYAGKLILFDVLRNVFHRISGYDFFDERDKILTR